ncbi:MAG: hypothetical protein HY054_02050 [Proteobacteria bacterium]|nr:hypothetical protein [Pseudomonadota bacterium]
MCAVRNRDETRHFSCLKGRKHRPTTCEASPDNKAGPWGIGCQKDATASRLYELAVALNVPVNYFFEGLQQSMQPATPGAPANDRDLIAADVLSQKETLELIRAYYKLGERPRRRLLDLAKALQDESTDAA